MTRSKSALPIKGTHGGRRPGAGAPKGNLNGIKHGLNSERFYRAALMIAAVPELRLLFQALQAAETATERRSYRRLLAIARHAANQDADLADSIKGLVLDRLHDATSQVGDRRLLLHLLDSQSSNQEPADGPLGHRGHYTHSSR